jgi:uncharacterized protein
MIYETIVTTQNHQGQVHIAPMGIHENGDDIIILPFKPSSTLDNILATGVGVLNFCDDVRIFAGCLTGRKEWPLLPAATINGSYLAATLAHTEFELIREEDDSERPKLFCRSLHEANHGAFKGFNRAQFSVLEAAILVSRLGMLPTEKIERELDYLRIGLEKTAGNREREAWGWLMDAVNQFKTGAAS